MVIIKRLAIAAIILLGTLAMLALYHPDLRPQAPPSGEQAARVDVGGAFTMTDGQGNTVSEDILTGHYSLVFFGFTHCPDICPLTLQVIAQALDDAGPAAANVTPVFVSVDPERDTPEAVGAYAAAFHPRFIALTGTPAQVQQITKVFRVFARKAPLKDENGNDTGDYTVEHSGMIFFLNPEGHYVTHFNNGTPAEGISAYITRAAASPTVAQ